jgi:SAM-dependent methyltransferase
MAEAEPPDPRRDLLLEGLPLTARVVEVGASFRPLVPKSRGWNACVVDHDTKQGLVAKYAAAAVSPDAIEDVDVIWREGPLHEAFPSADLGTFDAVVVSHVLEHMPDLLGFLDSVRRLVRDDGCLVFALPDKRWCFDFFRPHTLAGDVLQAHRERRVRHTPATLFNEVAYSVTLRGQPGWFAGESAAELVFAHPPGRARQVFDAVCRPADVYRDAHAWQFTPASFELLILDLAASGGCDWRIDWVRPTAAVEFLGRLRPGARVPDGEDLQRLRMEILRRMAREAMDQWKTILDADVAAPRAA